MGDDSQENRRNIKEDNFTKVKKWLNITIGIVISAAFIYLAFRRVHLREILYSLKHINYFWLIPNSLIVILTMVFRAERWKYLLKSVNNYKASTLFPSVMIGFMANNILPVRLGEFLRAYSLGAKTGESRSSIFATIVIERIFDSLALLLMFWLVIMFVPFPPIVKQFGIFTAVVNGIAILFLVILKQKNVALVNWLTRLFSFLPNKLIEKAEHILLKFVDGLKTFDHIKILGIVTLWSLILWIVTALSNYFIFMAFGIYPGFVASFILLLFVAAGVMLPSAPGFIGVYQAAIIGAFGMMNQIGIIGYQASQTRLEMTAISLPAFANMPLVGVSYLLDSAGAFGISKGESLSFSLVLWLCQYLPVTLLGLYYLRREHISLKHMNFEK